VVIRDDQDLNEHCTQSNNQARVQFPNDHPGYCLGQSNGAMRLCSGGTAVLFVTMAPMENTPTLKSLTSGIYSVSSKIIRVHVNAILMAQSKTTDFSVQSLPSGAIKREYYSQRYREDLNPYLSVGKGVKTYQSPALQLDPIPLRN